MGDNPQIIGSKLLNKGFIYTRSKFGENGVEYWDCQKLRNKQCRARAVSTEVNGNVVMTKEGEHDHAPNRELAEAERIKFEVKLQSVRNPEQGP